jgi:hypothetical protein
MRLRHTQMTSTLMTSVLSIVPLALFTAHTWIGLVGSVLTRTSYGLPLTRSRGVRKQATGH